MRYPLSALLAAGVLLSAAGETDFSASPHVRVRSIGLTDAAWTGGFWGARVKQAWRHAMNRPCSAALPYSPEKGP